jgi:hypothetical protein
MILPILASLLIAAPAAADAGTDKIIDRVMEAYGGSALEDIRSYRLSGTVTARMRGIEGGMIRTWYRPDKLRVELQYPGNPETRILDGDQGWRTSPQGGGVKKVDGALLKSMVLQLGRVGIPWILDENRKTIKAAPPRMVEGRLLIGLELSLGTGMTVRYYIHQSSNLVVFSEALLAASKMRTSFETYYSDHRKVRGVVFSFREKNVASGFHTGTTVIDKVELNPADVNRGYFRP